MNKIIIIGNLGQDPEMRYTPSGQSLTSFSLASNRRYVTASGEQKEETQWFNVTAWGRLAETCHQHLSKGQQTYVEGRIQGRAYTGRDGEKRFSLDVTATEVQFLGSRGHGGAAGGSGDEQQSGSGNGSGNGNGGGSHNEQRSGDGDQQRSGGQPQDSGEERERGPDGEPEPGQGNADSPPDIPFC